MLFSYKYFIFEFRNVAYDTYYHQTTLHRAKEILQHGFSEKDIIYDNILPEGISLKPIDRNVDAIMGENNVEVEVNNIRIKKFNTFEDYKNQILNDKKVKELYDEIKDIKFKTLQQLNNIRKKAADITQQKELINQYREKINPLYKEVRRMTKQQFQQIGFDAVSIGKNGWKDEPLERIIVFDNENIIAKRML